MKVFENFESNFSIRRSNLELYTDHPNLKRLKRVKFLCSGNFEHVKGIGQATVVQASLRAFWQSIRSMFNTVKTVICLWNLDRVSDTYILNILNHSQKFFYKVHFISFSKLFLHINPLHTQEGGGRGRGGEVGGCVGRLLVSFYCFFIFVNFFVGSGTYVNSSFQDAYLIICLVQFSRYS